MGTVHGTHEFGTGDLEGLAKYMKQRARGLKPHKRDVVVGYANVAETAADRICELERKVRFYESLS